MKLLSKIADVEHGVYIGPLAFDHDGLPTFEECRQLVRETAYHLRGRGGSPDGDWTLAEHVLFSGLEHGGYVVYVRDLTRPKIDDFYHSYRLVAVTPDGPVDPVWRKTWANRAT